MWLKSQNTASKLTPEQVHKETRTQRAYDGVFEFLANSDDKTETNFPQNYKIIAVQLKIQNGVYFLFLVAV